MTNVSINNLPIVANKFKITTKKVIDLVKAVINNNTVVPILETVFLQNDRLTVFNLETYVNIPYASGIEACIPNKGFISTLKMMEVPEFLTNADHAIFISEGKKKIKLMGEEPSKYPNLSFQKELIFEEIGSWGAVELEYLGKALKLVSKDDLRPAMTGVFAGNDIAATDAHRLYWKAIEPLKRSIIIPADSAKILMSFGDRNWKLFYTRGDNQNSEQVVLISEDGILVGFRPIDARFPDYKVVIPSDASLVDMKINNEHLRDEIKNALQFGNKHTSQVLFSINGSAKISAQDIDLGQEYENELVAEYGFAMGGDHNELIIPFNGKYLDTILAQTEEVVKFQFWTATKCALINGEYLIMPLALND
jgi:DNA polymerase-3 subunit beta